MTNDDSVIAHDMIGATSGEPVAYAIGVPEGPSGGRIVSLAIDVTRDAVVTWEITPESAKVLGEYLIHAAEEALSRPLGE